jgi:hypothetical protein
MRRIWFCRALSCLVVMLAGRACGQDLPAWWLEDPPETRAQDLLVGRGEAGIAGAGGEAQAWQYAREKAAADAAMRLAADVQREDVIEEAEFCTGASSRVESKYQQRHLVRASLRSVPEIRELARARSGDMVYVLVGISREELAGVYRRRIAQASRTVSDSVAAARRTEKELAATAMKQYAAALAAYEDLHESLNVYAMLRTPQSAAGETNLVEGLPPRAEIETALEALAALLPKWTRERLFDELLAPLAIQAKDGDAATGMRYYVHPLTFGDGEFASPFGANLADALAPVVATRFGWVPVAAPQDAAQVFTGRVRESGGGVQVTLRRQASDGGTAAVSCALLTTNDCVALGWGAARPSNWDAALRDEAALLATLKSDPMLRIEMRTDRPAGGPAVFRYGDKPRLWLRSNMPVRARVLHVFSDGVKALITDKYPDGFPIPGDMVNQWVPLPVKLVIGEPAGVEQILLQAVSGGELPPLATERVETGSGRYRVIVRGDLAQTLAASRGSELAEDALLSETVYVWTVVEK